MARTVSMGEAAKTLGVSVDTLRRWDRAGKLRTQRDERNRRRVPVTEVRRLSARPSRHRAGDRLSARNRFPGVVRSVEADGVMAVWQVQHARSDDRLRVKIHEIHSGSSHDLGVDPGLVKIEAGPHRITAAVTRDAVDELGLAPGVPATAAVKATSVMVDRRDE